MFTIFLFSFASSEVRSTVSVYYDAASESYTHVSGEYDSRAAARAILIDNHEKNGWFDLHVEANEANDDEIQAYAAGYAEGFISQSLFKPHMNNVYSNLCNKYIKCENGKIPTNVKSWFDYNYKWVKNTIESNSETGYLEFYWCANLMLITLNGMVKGYNSVDPNEQITIQDLWMFNSKSDILNVYRKLNSVDPTQEPVLEKGGTMYVTQFGEHEELTVAHSTWDSYGSSTKMSKRYRLHFHNVFSKISRRSLSSYPMMLHSDKGMTITDQGLVISATSIAIASSDLLNFISIQGFPFWLRELIADYISYNAKEWMENYECFPAGSGVEWTIVNLKQFLYRNDLLENSIVVIDEIPTMINFNDVTEVADHKNQYFASFDIPYDKEVYKLAGYEKLASINPDLYSYENSSRDKILGERAHAVNNRLSARELIRYNNINDNNQLNRPDLGISLRKEQATSPYCVGAIDAKITTVSRALHLHWEGAVGPSFDTIEPFKFDNYQVCHDVKHDNVPDELGFGWTNHYFDIDI